MNQLYSAVLVIVCFTLVACNRNARKTPRPRIDSKRAMKSVPLSDRFSSEQTFAFVLPPLKSVQGVGGLAASDCGGCHDQIYREWSASNHAFALNDLQYQAELYKPSSPRWLCLNCHIPLQNQRRHILQGLENADVMRPIQKPNPGFDRSLQQEAITCATCHVRQDQMGDSLIVGPFDNSEAPHPVKRDKKLLRDICMRCHDPKGERITPTLICWFLTRKEWKESRWYGTRHCVDCHMPETTRRLAAAPTDLPFRDSHQHHWVGSGIPKWYDGYDKLIERGYRPGVDIKRVTWKRLAGESSIELEIELHNARAGHWLPTGDPERALLLLATIETYGGDRLAQATHRIGQTWNWRGQAEKLGDNRLKVDERRTWKATLKSSTSSKGTRLVVLIYHLRLTSENARHMKSSKVSDTYVKGATKLVPDIEKHYPMVNIIYREEIELSTGKRRLFTTDELLTLSKNERSKPLDRRDY